MDSLKNKKAIVTGSTCGIGLQIARSLAAEKADVILNGFGDPAEIEKIRSSMAEEYGVKVSYLNADVSKPEQIKKMISEAGDIDILVNNAGIQYVEDIEHFPKEKWDAIIAINLSSSFHAIASVIPQMKKKRSGRIINIASAHGLVGSQKKSAYVAAKHALIGLTKVTALETAEFGITCNAVCPGWVLTDLVNMQIKELMKVKEISYDKAKVLLVSEKHPNKEFVTSEEIGSLVVYLCNEMARSITGASICIDGGWTIQ